MSKQWRDKRACKCCGFVRTVLIREHQTFETTGEVDEYRRPKYRVSGTSESYGSDCTACKFEANAAKYERLAAHNRKRAAEARAAQAMRRLAPFKVKP